MRTETITIQLTDRQAEVADWLLGCPSMEEWFDPDHEQGHDFSHLDNPELEGNELTLQVDGHLLHNIEQELDRYGSMAYEAAKPTTASAEARVADNLKSKIFKAVFNQTEHGESIAADLDGIKEDLARRIREANDG